MAETILYKKGANFFGFESIDAEGKKHSHPLVVRGSGDLTLTEDGLHFIQWISKKEYYIPLSDIIKVEVGGSHNLKAKWPSKVLKVHYPNMDQTLILGVAVGGKLSLTKGYKDDCYIWKEKIEEMINSSTDPS
jgi:hypothetical protein